MQCFTHDNVQAVGVCKSCGKAVCRSCAKDLGFAIVCGDACAKEATAIQEMLGRSKRIYGLGLSRRRLPLLVIMFTFSAVVFGGLGIFESYRSEELDWLPLLFAVGCGFMAAIAYRRMKDTGI